MAFIVIGVLGFIWMGFWIFMLLSSKSKHVNKAELEYIEQDNYEEEETRYRKQKKRK